MSSNECKKIEKEINSILRDLASGKNDASCAVSTFPLAEAYEENFPAINHSPYKHERKFNSYPLPQAQNSYRNYKPVRRTEGKFHDREEKDFHEHGMRRRKDNIKPKPQKLEVNRNFDIKKHAIDRKFKDDKLEFDDSNLHTSKSLRNKLKDKETHVLTSEDMILERSISTNTSKKIRSFKHSNKERKEQMGRPKAIDDKIQASIFRNALTEASSIGETSSRRDKMKKVIEDKGYYETEGTTHVNEGKAHAAYHTESCVTTTSNEEIGSSDKKAVWGIPDKYPSIPVSSEQLSTPEIDAVETGDQFITHCNKEQCHCSEDSLYCTLCDFHIDNQRELERHRKQMSHEVRKKDFFRVKGLKALIPPSQYQLATIEELLHKIYITHCLENEDGKQRRYLLRQLTNDLSSEIEEDCTFHLFGSSINGFGHKESNINIDLEVPQGVSPSKMLLKTFDALKEQGNKYGNITNDFYLTFPLISFVDHRTKLPCEITLNNDSSRKTSTLLKQYAQFDHRVRKLGVIFRMWAKVCGIDRQDFCSLPPHSFPLMVIYFLQQSQPPVLPILHEMVDEKEVLTCDVRNAWKSNNEQTLAELWMDLLKFYATIFQFKAHVICIRQKEPLLCKEKKWTMRMMCIEDPYHTKRNVARTIANPQWFQYILECIRSTFEYFCTCKLPQAVGEVLAEVENSSNDEEEESGHSLEENSIDIYFEDQDKDLQLQSVIASIKAMDLEDRTAGVCPKSSNRETYEQHKDNEDAKTKDTPTEKKNTTELKSLQMLENSSAKECVVYKFERSHLINAKPPALFCRQCQKPNHVKKNCSIDDNLPEMKKLPKMEQDHRDMLTELSEKVYFFCRPSEENIQHNKLLLSDLQNHIQYIFRDAQLELFGSSCNGFGFGDSDLDICLTFHNKSEEDFDQKEIIELLTKELSRYRKIRNILPIPTAKVPIIKFSFPGRKEGDISLYNTLGQHNTRLLSTYCKIDQRVQLLGYSLKYFAKKCDICDASRGSLSSYAYILMAIFYLQQLEVPVIPVLQELYDHNEKMPERYVDNWNTWFFEDISKLSRVWDGYGKNKQCLGDLWMGLLIFYTEKFKMTEFVISIRQKALLTRFEKLWNTRSIAIEDPFDLSHNLGAGISGKMNSFILAAFRRGRELCGRTPPARRDISNLMEYFFNSKILTGGEKPPNERGCRVCSKIGHKMKECPLRREHFRKRHFERRNTNTEQRQGNFKNRNQCTERNRGDRHGMGNARGTFRTWNFHNSRDQRENKRTVTNCNPNSC